MDETSRTHTIGSLYEAFDPIEARRRKDGRNQTTKRVDWPFATDDAPIKLRRLYPQVLS